MVLALLRLPSPRISQRGENAEIKPGEGVQALPQLGQAVFRLANLLADRPEHGADTRGFGLRDPQQAIKPTGIAEELE